MRNRHIVDRFLVIPTIETRHAPHAEHSGWDRDHRGTLTPRLQRIREHALYTAWVRDETFPAVHGIARRRALPLAPRDSASRLRPKSCSDASSISDAACRPVGGEFGRQPPPRRQGPERSATEPFQGLDSTTLAPPFRLLLPLPNSNDYATRSRRAPEPRACGRPSLPQVVCQEVRQRRTGLAALKIDPAICIKSG